MAVPLEINELIDRLKQELNETEQQATEGLNLLRPILSRFPDNATLIQFFSYFNASLFFVVDSRRRIEAIVEMLSSALSTADQIQEAGADMGSLLGQVLEVKINTNRLKTRLENWP